MILGHLDKPRVAVADVLSASTIHDPRVADREGLYRHHYGNMVEQREIALDIVSKCFIDILLGDFRRHESWFLRILWPPASSSSSSVEGRLFDCLRILPGFGFGPSASFIWTFSFGFLAKHSEST